MDRRNNLDQMTEGESSDDSLVICDLNSHNKSDFMDSVDNDLIRRGCKDLDKFSLQMIQNYISTKTDLGRITQWIRYATHCKVSKLQLYLTTGPYENATPVRLPYILSCNSLVELKLEKDIIFGVPPIMPSLKVLDVTIRRPSSEFLSRLFSSCPILECISIYGELYNDDEVNYTFDISVPTLKRLNIELICSDFEGFSSHIEFIVRTPQLEFLVIDDASFATYSIDEMPSLVEATVGIGHTRNIRSNEIDSDEAGTVMGVLNAIRKAKFLTLMENTTAALGHAFRGGLPQFPCLTRLQLAIDNCYRWRLLGHFLKNSPRLQSLQLDKERDAIYEGDEDEIVAEEDWIAPRSAPYCLMCSLKEITINSLMGSEAEKEVVKYILENSMVLEKMSIKFDENASKDELNENTIQSFQRVSNKCELEFV